MRAPISCTLLASSLLLAAGCDSKKEAAPEPEAKAKDAKAAEAAAKAEIAKTEAEIDAKAKAEPPPPPEEEDYGGEFCATIVPCFQKLEFSGSFVADVAVDIEPDGSVASVSYTGDAPKPVQTCITDTIKGIKLADYNGKLGRTTCKKSGQLMGGSQMIMSDSSYEVREEEAAEAKAEAPADGEAPAEAKADG